MIRIAFKPTDLNEDDLIEQLFADYVPEGEEDPLDELDRRCAEIDAREKGNEEVGEPKPLAPPEPSPESIKPTWKPHDPTRMPDGSKVPQGYNWDGVRLVRNRKGSKRPPDTPSEFWTSMSRTQREADIERYRRKVELEEAEEQRKRRAAAPAMPVGPMVQEPHREKLSRLYVEKLCEVAQLQYGLHDPWLVEGSSVQDAGFQKDLGLSEFFRGFEGLRPKPQTPNPKPGTLSPQP